MNRIRKQFANEVEQLCPVLHETYRRIGIFQKNRTVRNERRLLERLEAVAPLLAFFRPHVPARKQGYFLALADDSLEITDRIVALDVAVGSLHIAFPVQRAYMHQESRRLRDVLEICRSCENGATMPPASTPAGALVRGIAASPGTAVGPAFVARRNSDYRRLPPGAVLVTPMPRPEFIDHLRAVVGIVTDNGGALCHAAIVARELGLPCVVGTRRATVVVKTGWQIGVNGSTGVVTRISE